MSFKDDLTKRFLLLSLSLALLSAVSAAVYAIVRADISYQGAPVYILDILGKCLHSLLFSAFFAYILHLLYYRILSVGSVLVLAETLLFSHLVTVIGLIAIDAAWSADKILPYLASAFSELLFEIVILALFGAICYFIVRNRQHLQPPLTIKTAALLRFPIQGSALLGALLLYVPQLVNTLSFDIYYGAPASPLEWAQLILYYCEDLLCKLMLPYIFILVLSAAVHRKKQKGDPHENI